MVRRLFSLIPFLLWPPAAAGISLLLNISLLGSIFIFLGIPAVYLSFRQRGLILKAALFSLATALPIGIIWDYIAHLNHQWLGTTIFPVRFFGLVTIEDLLWGLFLTYTVILFYEFFLDRSSRESFWHPRMTILAFFLILLVVMFLGTYWLAPELLRIPYSYFWIAITVLLIPSLVELGRRPNLLSKFLVTGLYFFFLNLVYEITALKLALWDFPGDQYIGTLSVAGVHFPLEEFFLISSAIAILSYYEPFDDDEK